MLSSLPPCCAENAAQIYTTAARRSKWYWHACLPALIHIQENWGLLCVGVCSPVSLPLECIWAGWWSIAKALLTWIRSYRRSLYCQEKGTLMQRIHGAWQQWHLLSDQQDLKQQHKEKLTVTWRIRERSANGLRSDDSDQMTNSTKTGLNFDFNKCV